MRVVALATRERYPFSPQHVADLALGERHLEFLSKALGQLLLGESRVLFFLLAQPDPTLAGYLVGVTVAMVDQCHPGRASSTVTLAQFRQIILAETQTQFLTEAVEDLAPVEALEQLLLGQGAIDLADRIAFHELPSR